ncbi:MAG: MFS transporter [Alphaproteobacteria bacterium]|nr:MAG: MFS transporter [Alphaproteobacteria bacterium]
MLPRNIWVINLAGLLCNISTSLVFGLSASFLRTVLGVNPADIGLFQGIVDASSYGTKLTAGFFSDFLRKRRALILFGIALVAISKPMLGFSMSLSVVFLARILDRVGNGIQSTPRDALIADLCDTHLHGRCYGLRNALTVLGSAIGSILGIKLMVMTGENFHLIFNISTIPALLSLGIAYFFIPDSFALQKDSPKRFHWGELKIFGRKFWEFILVIFIFFSFKYNETILAVKATEYLGLSHAYSSAIFLIYNIAMCAVAYPVGAMSDNSPKEKILFGCLIVSALAHLTCGLAATLPVMFMGVILWGVQTGASNAVMFTLIASYAPFHLRGTAFSIFFLTGFFATLASSMIFRYLCNGYGLNATFYAGAVGVFFAAVMLYGFFREKFRVSA